MEGGERKQRSSDGSGKTFRDFCFVFGEGGGVNVKRRRLKKLERRSHPFSRFSSPSPLSLSNIPLSPQVQPALFDY